MRGVSKRRRGTEFEEFPELIEHFMRRFPQRGKASERRREAQGEINYHDISQSRRDRALRARSPRARSPKFMTAPSPGIIASTMLNAYYDSHDAYLDALAREMRQRISGDP